MDLEVCMGKEGERSGSVSVEKVFVAIFFYVCWE